MRRSIFLAAGAAAAASALAKPARAQFTTTPITPGQPQYVQQLTIGISAPLSGSLMAFGDQVVQGARAAVNENNQYNGPLERVFAIRTFDDQDALAIGMTNVDIAAADSTIVAMIGNLTTDVTMGCLPNYANDQMPLFVPASTADAITLQNYRNVFRLPTNDTTCGTLYARMVLPMRKPTFALAVTQDGDYGADVAQGFAASAKAQKLRADILVFPINSPDYAAVAKTIVQEHADFLFLCGKTGDMGPLIPALHAAGFTGTFGLSDGFYNGDTLKQYGAALVGSWTASSMPPLELAPADFQIITDFEHEFGQQITTLGAYGYAAAQIIMQASQRAGATTRQQLLQTMQQGGAYNTILGDFSFTFGGDPVDPNLFFYTIQPDTAAQTAGTYMFKYQKPAHSASFLI